MSYSKLDLIFVRILLLKDKLFYVYTTKIGSAQGLLRNKRGLLKLAGVEITMWFKLNTQMEAFLLWWPISVFNCSSG